MACSAPRDCGECAGCQRASAEHEAKLDRVQTVIETEIAKQRDRDRADLYDQQDVEMLGAGIVNELVREGWLDMAAIPA